jgi:hypothetical protein
MNSVGRRAAHLPWLAAAWTSVAVLSAYLGIAYILGEKQLFVPGGWFALDGRRLLAASSAWLAGGEPYAVRGFLYSPVALILAAPWTLLPQAVAIVGWIATSAALAVIAVIRTLRARPLPEVLVAVIGVVGFLPTLADLALANVTIALVVAILPMVRTNRVRAGLAFGVLAAAFPKPLAIPILLWALLWRRQAAVGVIVGGLAASVVAALVVGTTTTSAFLSTLASGGGISLRFLGNYGISLFSPPLALIVGAMSAAAFVFVLARRGPIVGLAWAGAVGVMIAPYAGIYASLPMLVALPGLASIAPAGAWFSALAIALVAPWSPISAVGLMAFTLIMPQGRDPGERTLIRTGRG